MEVHLVADTNLFFECKSLEQLPWLELGYDPVVILLTKPVLDEIDKHKKASGRTRARALEIFSRARNMLTLSVQEIEIQSSSPKVILRRMPSVKPDSALKGDLDYAKTDEILIGIVSTLNAQAAGYSVKLFTDDTGPAMSADGLGVPYLMINESWRRPPSETTEDKKIKELEKDLATYRAQEPKISISSCETANESNVVEVTRKVATPLTEVEVEGILAALRLKHPLATDFTPPPSSSTTDPSGGVMIIEYASPAEDDIANYRDVIYPQWIDQCRKILKSLHEGRDEIEPPVVLRWPMSNKGTRPAAQVRIEFEAKGSLELRRLHVDAEDGEVAEADNASSQSPVASVTQFPSAPRLPSFQKQVTCIPPPAKPKLTQGLDITTLKAAGLLDKNYIGITDMSKVLGLGYLDPLFKYTKELNALTEAAKLSQRQSSMFGVSNLDALLNPSRFATIPYQPTEFLTFPRYYVPEPHVPERFYFDWPVAQPVKKGTLTCEFWRHQTGEEIFEFEVLFTKEGEARGIVECTVHAENLTKPEQARVIVSRTIEPLSMVDLANAMIEACK